MSSAPGRATTATVRRDIVSRLAIVAGAVALIVGLFPSALGAVAEPENPLEPLDTSSPQATYLSFIDHVELVEELLIEYELNRTESNQRTFSAQIERAGTLFDLSEVPESNRREVLAVSFGSLADILNRIPPPDVDEIPDADDVAAAEASALADLIGSREGGREDDAANDGAGFLPSESITGYTIPGTEIRIRQLEDGSRAGNYVFSADTVSQLPGWRDAVDDLPVAEGVRVQDWVRKNAEFTGHLVPQSLVDTLPGGLDGEFLGSPLWKFLVDVLILVLVALVVLVWYRFVGRRGAPGTASGYLIRLTTPVMLVVLMSLARRFMDEQVNHGGDAASLVNTAITITIWVAIAWGFWILTNLVVEWVISTPTIRPDSGDAHLLRLLAKVVSVIGSLCLVTVGLSRVGISAVGLGIGAGVAGLAVALAATSTLENLLGGITVYIDKPFRVGDKITINDDYGTVEAIGPRSTSIRRLDDTLVNLPNSDISRARVVNFTARGFVLFSHVIGVRYETTLDQLSVIVDAIGARFREHPMVRDEAEFPRTHVSGFGASSIDIEIQAHVDTDDWGVFTAVREDLLLLVMEIVEAAGTGFAFPSSTTYLADDTGLPDPTDSDVLFGDHRTGTPTGVASRHSPTHDGGTD